MRDPRAWTVVLSITWFLCGFGAGHLVSGRADDGRDPAPHVLYAQELSRAFGLDDLGRSTLLALLEQREIDREAVRRSHAAQTRALMEPALRAIDEDVERIIRDTILPPSKRDEFDRQCAARILEPAPASPESSSPAPNSPSGAPAPSGD